MILNKVDLKALYGKRYVENFEKKQHSYRIEQFLHFLNMEDTFVVADFACGSGMLMGYIAPNVKQYFGVDFSEEFIKVANGKKKLLKV